MQGNHSRSGSSGLAWMESNQVCIWILRVKTQAIKTNPAFLENNIKSHKEPSTMAQNRIKSY